MRNIQVISDSSCDLNYDYIEKNSIKIVPFSITLDGGKTYLKEKEEITIDEFYKTLHEKSIFPKTSLPSVTQYIDAFKESIDKGEDVICVCLSSKFSGSYQSAVNAMEILKDEAPEGNIVVIDSQHATGGQGLIVEFAKKLVDEGLELKAIEKIINDNVKNVKTYLTLSSLEYLQKGGRLGKGSALIGSVLNINPILKLDNGELEPLSKVRGRKKAIIALCDYAKKEIGDKKIEDLEIRILKAEIDETIKLDEILKTTLETDIVFEELQLGVTIGAHTGFTATGVAIADFKY